MYRTLLSDIGRMAEVRNVPHLARCEYRVCSHWVYLLCVISMILTPCKQGAVHFLGASTFYTSFIIRRSPLLLYSHLAKQGAVHFFPAQFAIKNPPEQLRIKSQKISGKGGKSSKKISGKGKPHPIHPCLSDAIFVNGVRNRCISKRGCAVILLRHSLSFCLFTNLMRDAARFVQIHVRIMRDTLRESCEIPQDSRSEGLHHFHAALYEGGESGTLEQAVL